MTYSPVFKIKCVSPNCICYIVSNDEGESIKKLRAYLSISGWVEIDDKDYCPKHKPDNYKDKI